MKSNILILDDNKSVLTALEMLLQTEFDHVFTLKNPNNLIFTIQQEKIDVVQVEKVLSEVMSGKKGQIEDLSHVQNTVLKCLGLIGN